MMGIYSEFVPVHVQVSELLLVPESEIVIYKPPGQSPVTKYRIGPGQVEKVDEYIAQKTKYSPWALRKKAHYTLDVSESLLDIEPGFELDSEGNSEAEADIGERLEEGNIEKSRARKKAHFNKARVAKKEKRRNVTCVELAAGGL